MNMLRINLNKKSNIRKIVIAFNQYQQQNLMMII